MVPHFNIIPQPTAISIQEGIFRGITKQGIALLVKLEINGVEINLQKAVQMLCENVIINTG